MWYRCRRCDHEETRGVLPAASCGLYISMLLGVALGVLLGVVRWWFPAGLGWWWLVGAPILLIAGFAASLVLMRVFELIEWLAFCARKCPGCAGRRWSRGFTKGFGL